MNEYLNFGSLTQPQNTGMGTLGFNQLQLQPQVQPQAMLNFGQLANQGQVNPMAFNPANFQNFNNMNLEGTANTALTGIGMQNFNNNVQQPNYQQMLTPQAQQPGFFDGVSGSDWLNFGGGLLSTGLGAYYQNQQLDQNQQALDLNKQKYTDMRADRDALASANQERQQRARTELAGQGYNV